MKLRNIMLLMILLLLTFGYSTFGQVVFVDSMTRQGLISYGIEPDNRAQVLNALRSTNILVRSYAIRFCGEEGIREALPIFKELFASYPATDYYGDRTTILMSVMDLEDTTFQNEFRIAIDSLRIDETNYSKIFFFTNYLIKKHHDEYGFFAIYPYFADTVKIIKYKPAVYMLVPFFNTQHRNQIIDVLKLNVRLNPDNDNRIRSLSYLKTLGYADIQNLCIYVSRNDPAFEVRDYGRRILSLVNKNLYRSELLHAIQIETVPAPDRAINYTYLIMTREPSSYKYVYDVLNEGIDIVNNWLIRLELDNPNLFKPDSTEATTKLIDSLRAAVPQISSYNWLGNQTFVNELDAMLTSARNYLSQGDSINCARQIFTFQKKVNEEYRDSLDGDTRTITREGWKFLYYNAEYILERLPGVVTLPSSVNTGWNMISVPVDASSYIKSELYPNSTSNAFMFYGGYVRKDTLENGIGYWLKFGTNDTLKYKGFPIEIDTIDVAAGWNMIGSISSNLNRSKIKSENTEIVSPFFGFQNGYQVDTVIISGKSYWVKVSQSGKIILDKYATAGVGQPPSETPPPPPGAPDIPNLYSPNNGSTGVSKTPTLIWFSSIKAQTYRLQVSTNSTFTNLVFDDSTLTTTSKQIGTLANSTTYYWRVNAKNPVWTSDWSSVFWFRTLGIPPPPDPCQPIDAFSAMDEFTVSDLNGNKQQLFAHNGGRRLALGLIDYDMPPEPIEDVFHAKFQSGRFVESVPPGKGISKIPIKIKNANFPVTINWNIRPESNTKYWLYKSGRDKILLSGVGSTTINSLDGNLLLIEAQAILPDPCY